MLESRTEGALKDEMARPFGAWTRVLLSCLVCGAVGCSAITATIECREAERALKHAPSLANDPANLYQLTLARAYLDKAREEAAEAHYGEARLLAQAAKGATRRAGQGSKGRHE